MSDFWYRDPPTLPPIEHMGRLWTWDGRCLNPDAPRRDELPPEWAWLTDWPEDLQYEALKAAVNMQLYDDYLRAAGIEPDRRLT